MDIDLDNPKVFETPTTFMIWECGVMEFDFGTDSKLSILKKNGLVDTVSSSAVSPFSKMNYVFKANVACDKDIGVAPG